MSKLDDQIRDYYGSCYMSKNRLDALLDAGQQCSHSRSVMTWSVGLAAALILVTTFINFLFPREIKETGAKHIAMDIAVSHAKELDPEYRTTDYVELQAMMTRVDYSIVPPKQFVMDNYALVGARYCSMYACLAVQLKLRDKMTGEPITLYIAKLDDVLRNSESDVKVIDGVHVQVWHDDNRFYAMARGNTNKTNKTKDIPKPQPRSYKI